MTGPIINPFVGVKWKHAEIIPDMSLMAGIDDDDLPRLHSALTDAQFNADVYLVYCSQLRTPTREACKRFERQAIPARDSFGFLYHPRLYALKTPAHVGEAGCSPPGQGDFEEKRFGNSRRWTLGISVDAVALENRAALIEKVKRILPDLFLEACDSDMSGIVHTEEELMKTNSGLSREEAELWIEEDKNRRKRRQGNRDLGSTTMRARIFALYSYRYAQAGLDAAAFQKDFDIIKDPGERTDPRLFEERVLSAAKDLFETHYFEFFTHQTLLWFLKEKLMVVPAFIEDRLKPYLQVCMEKYGTKGGLKADIIKWNPVLEGDKQGVTPGADWGAFPLGMQRFYDEA